MVWTLAIDWFDVGVRVGIAGFLLVCVLLILTVLIQRPQGGGLAGAFGSSAGSGQTAFGAKTGDALTIFTIAVFVLYLAAAVGLNYAVKPGAPPAAEGETASQSPGTSTPGTDETLVPINLTPAAPPSAAPATDAQTPSPQPQGTQAQQTPPASPGASPPPAPGNDPPTIPEPTPTEPKPEDPKPAPAPPG